MTIKEQVFEWDNKYPVDFYWRRKNNVRFGSLEHKSMDFISMLFSLIEDKEFEKMIKSKAEDEDNEFDYNKFKMKSQEVDKLFDEIDINDF